MLYCAATRLWLSRNFGTLLEPTLNPLRSVINSSCGPLRTVFRVALRTPDRPAPLRRSLIVVDGQCNSWPSRHGHSMLSVGMIVVPAIMPLSELRCAIWMCVLAVQGVRNLEPRPRIFYARISPA